MHEAKVYHKLGLGSLALKAAESCQQHAFTSKEYRKASEVWVLLGHHERAIDAAKQSSIAAKNSDDCIEAIRALSHLGLKEEALEAKEKCFDSMKPRHGAFSAAKFYRHGFREFAQEAAELEILDTSTAPTSLIGAARYFHREGMTDIAIRAATLAEGKLEKAEDIKEVQELLRRFRLDE